MIILETFLKPNKEKNLFSPNESIKKCFIINKFNLESHNILVNLEFQDEVLINGYESEFSQVILNILSNAKDAFVEKQINTL